MILPSVPSPKDEDALADLPRWHRALLRGRFLLGGVYFLAFALLVWAVFCDRRLLDLESDRKLRDFLILSAVFFGMQALLLVGAPPLRRPRPTRRRWMYVSITIGALMAAMLSFGFSATLTSMLGEKLKWPEVFGDSVWIALAVVIGAPWLFWFGIFGFLWAGEWSGRFRRMYRLLLGGTVLELLITIPVDVQVRKRTRCYCEEGTFFSLMIGITMAFWTFGPGIILLFLDIRHRRRYRAGCCAQCGYDLRGLSEARCPECGTPFEGKSRELTRIDANQHP